METTVEDLARIAERRHRLHRQQATSRPLSPDYELVGLVGEYTLSRQTGLPMDLVDRPAGDNRIDFRTPAGTLDVKTARKAFNLLREVGKPHADILILARYDDPTRTAELIGWEYDWIMRRCPKKDFGYGIVNHYKPAPCLRPMAALYALLRHANR